MSGGGGGGLKRRVVRLSVQCGGGACACLEYGGDDGGDGGDDGVCGGRCFGGWVLWMRGLGKRRHCAGVLVTEATVPCLKERKLKVVVDLKEELETCARCQGDLLV